MVSRRTAAVFAIALLAIAAAALLARGSTSTSSAPSTHGRQHLATLEGGGRGEESGGAAGEAYRDRAFPADSISIDEIQSAIAANNAVARHNGATLGSKWDFIGPETLDVDRLGTQSFIKSTQW